MSDRKRLRLRDPARTAPIRNFSKLYRSPEAVNGTNPAEPNRRIAPRRTANRSPLAEGVELAYSVINKYIAEGRRTAEEFNNEPYSYYEPNDNLQEILERLWYAQTEMLPLWVETLAKLVRVDPARNGYPAATGTGPHSNGAHNAEGAAVSVEVVSLRPVRVSVDLRPNSEAQSLVALPLNAVARDIPALTDVHFASDEVSGQIKLRLRIPENQPPGTYSGVIVNSNTAETRGTLSVRIAD